ncbi:MAG: BatA domain-containing protein, partial [Cyclobacteriaceae bacterium]|nr:BatA domain-containing protein [Cyclobacteriaceae bacterium]
MNFLAPHFFYGLFALLIPIIIHLFNFRKTKRVFFSSTQFLKKINEQTSSRRTLKQLLILLSRLLFLVFLVLTFTQPFIPAKESALQNSVQIYLDNSYSMSNESDMELQAFDQALEYVRDIINLYPESSRFRLITNDPDPFSNRYRSSSEVLEKLTEVSLSRFSKNTEEVYEKITDDVGIGTSSDNYWISDFQKSFASSVQTDTTFEVRLVPLSFTGTQNVFVDTLYLEDPFVKGKQSLSLVVRLYNTSRSEVRNLITRVFVNDNQITSSSFDIPANGYKEAVFDLAFSLEEDSKGSVRFEDFPVSFDNEMYFVLTSGKKINVVEIRGKEESPYIPEVFGNRELYDFSSQSVLTPNYEAIVNANLVVLNELESINPSLLFQLKSLL